MSIISSACVQTKIGIKLHLSKKWYGDDTMFLAESLADLQLILDQVIESTNVASHWVCKNLILGHRENTTTRDFVDQRTASGENEEV